MKIKHLIIIIILCATVIPTSSAEDELPEHAIARLGKGRINVMQFSPDGTRLAIGTTIGVWLYNLETGTEEGLPVGDISNFNTLAYSSNGKILASGSLNNPTILLWDTIYGNLLPIGLRNSNSMMKALTFSQTNNSIIGLSMRENIILSEWNIETGAEVRQKNLNVSNYVFAFSNDGLSFVGGDREYGDVRTWVTAMGLQTIIFREKTDMAKDTSISSLDKIGVQAIAYSPDRKTITSAHHNNRLRIWDVATKAERHTFIGHAETVNAIAYSQDSTIVATSSSDNTILLWDVATGKQKTKLTGHKNSIRTLAFSPTDNDLLASGSDDGTVRFWDINTGKERSIFRTEFTEYVKDFVFTHDNTTVVSALENGTVQNWDVKNGKQLPAPILPHHDTMVAIALSADGALFACRGADTSIESDSNAMTISINPEQNTNIFRLTDGKKLHSVQGKIKALRSMQRKTKALWFSPDNKLLAIKDNYGILLTEVNSGKEIHRLASPKLRSRVVDVVAAFSPDNTILATGGLSGETHLWNITSGENVHILKNKGTTFFGNAQAFAFSPDNSVLAVKYSGSVGFWDMKTKQSLYQNLAEKLKFIESIVFSPDGKFLLTVHRHVDAGTKFTVWDFTTESKLLTLSGHAYTIESMKFSHDGQILATASSDGTILLWDWNKILNRIETEKIGTVDP